MGLAFSPVRPRVCSAKSSPLFFLWLTACTTNCPSTLQKGVSQPKSLLNDRHSLRFGMATDPSFFVWTTTPSFSSQSCVPTVPPSFSINFFAPRDPGLFAARCWLCFFDLLYAGFVGGVWVAVLLVLTAPCRLPAPPDTPHCCFTRPRSVRLPGRSLAPLPGCLHPQWFCFSNDNSMRSFPPAPVSLLNK